MGNNIYTIPIRKLYDEKNDPNMESFISGLKIDLNKKNDYLYPTVLEIKKAIINVGLKITNEKNENFQKGEGWFCEIKETEKYDTIISVDNIKSKDELITDIISFPYGKWETILSVLFELEKTIGPILFYCDSGEMTIVEKNKTIEQVVKEME